jgi:DNA polymerase III epsilon subunit-like protein
MIFAVFDTETTGLPLHHQAPLALQPRVIEFGGILTDGAAIIDTLHFKCNPHRKLEKVITDITGLTDEMLEGEQDFSYHVDSLRSFFGRARGRIAHNLSFDKSMLKFDLERNKQDLQDILWMPGLEICSVEQTFHEYGKRMKLKELYELFFGKHVQTHRALEDVEMLHAVCQKTGIYESFQNVDR